VEPPPPVHAAHSAHAPRMCCAFFLLQAAGWWGIFTSALAFYIGLAILFEEMWGREVRQNRDGGAGSAGPPFGLPALPAFGCLPERSAVRCPASGTVLAAPHAFLCSCPTEFLAPPVLPCCRCCPYSTPKRTRSTQRCSSHACQSTTPCPCPLACPTRGGPVSGGALGGAPGWQAGGLPGMRAACFGRLHCT
jgi:hypothetical protein